MLSKLESMSLDQNDIVKAVSNQAEELKKANEAQSRIHRDINASASGTASILHTIQATSESTHSAVTSLKQKWARAFEA
jgi:hypothetical protein